MGSSGSGNFSDYQGFNGNGESPQGGSSNKDKCGKAFSTKLEEVQTCEFFLKYSDVPPDGTTVEISFINPRLAVLDSNKMCIGYLPTKFNYLRSCLTDNFSYAGIVSNSTLNPIPSITVDISPV